MVVSEIRPNKPKAKYTNFNRELCENYQKQLKKKKIPNEESRRKPSTNKQTKPRKPEKKPRRNISKSKSVIRIQKNI